MWLVSYLPVSNILPLVNTANDRYMYLPMVGFCLAVSSAVYHVHDRRIGGRISLRFLLMVALLLSCSWLTVKRNSVFDDSYSLYSDAVRYVPDNIRVRYNLGLANMLRKNSRKAINEFEEVTRLNPFYKRNDVWFLTGVCYEQMGDYTRAKQYCKKGTLLRMRKDALTAYAGMLWKEGDLDQAALFMQVNAHFYPDPITYCNLGRYYARMNDLSQAVECFKKAVEMEPVDPVMWGCLLNACNRLGDGKLVEKETYRMIAALSRNGGYLERTTDGEIFHVSRRDFR
jgi:tetratricopeptide (TPR) repeat protein